MLRLLPRWSRTNYETAHHLASSPIRQSRMAYTSHFDSGFSGTAILENSTAVKLKVRMDKLGFESYPAVDEVKSEMLNL